MTAKRKSRRSRESAPEVVIIEPSENQLDHAMAEFERAKVRYRLMQLGERCVRVMIQPDWMVDSTITKTFSPRFITDEEKAKQKVPTLSYRDFTDEASARQWREREIIREAITAGMRAKP